jgi:hypothetical protein
MVNIFPANLAIPPLENGDRLNRFEFERRYNAMPAVKKGDRPPIHPHPLLPIHPTPQVIRQQPSQLHKTCRIRSNLFCIGIQPTVKLLPACLQALLPFLSKIFLPLPELVNAEQNCLGQSF